MNCLSASFMNLSVPARHFGTYFLVRKGWVALSQHYIGTERIKLPPRCTSTIVPTDQIVRTTKDFLLDWDTDKLHTFHKLCEMDLWQTLFCNSHIVDHGTKELCFKREDDQTEYWIAVMGVDSEITKLASEWRSAILNPDTVPLLTEDASVVSRLPFDWLRYQASYLNRINVLKALGLPRKDRLNIQYENGFGIHNSCEDLTGSLDESYTKLYRLYKANLNPFIALNFCNASSLREVKVLTSVEGAYKIITLK